MSLIILKDLKKIIRSQQLFYVDHLKAARGEKIGIVGRNGCGKSTLAKIMAKKDNNYTGNILVKGKLVYVPQLPVQIAELSGGQAAFAVLQRAFKQKPSILILDEPTANLDERHQQWLCKQLLQSQGLLLFISHDRNLLTKVATSIWEIKDKRVTAFKGKYVDYSLRVTREQKKQRALYQNQTKKQKEITAAVQRKKQKAASVRKGRKMGQFERKNTKFLREATAAKIEQNARKILKRNRRTSTITKPIDPFNIKMMQTALPPFEGKTVISATGFNLNYKSKKLLKETTFKIKPGEKIALLGPNGSGKSTLLSAIFKCAQGLFISKSARIGFFKQNLISLPQHEEVGTFIRQKAVLDYQFVRRFMGALGISAEFFTQKIASLSGGELVKLQLAAILTGKNNVLLLDEPTNFLDMTAISALEEFLQKYPGTVIFAAHDKMFCRHVATRTLVFQQQDLIDPEQTTIRVTPKTELPLLKMEYDRALLDSTVTIDQLRVLAQKIHDLEKS
ncbi:ATP-binding cassette domain-containing protein [Liquorilactobacillus capillatus]|uniref:ABC superfamily ATP binding cassette transporter, ABC protein n=1 Tax=Liquorilactobacillus capillatus DSM 19910 TaxID=1423731 RepID=A0A0R1LZV1_9LACO|nr:ATP-binding cassette domain-containing protein [Liquorilactobacillus capillatus]KRL01102.1 ABC superfamily ATP binding cassette transporter, ABC protein [Liquorilactobacillus capillatus DSM 19910]